MLQYFDNDDRYCLLIKGRFKNSIAPTVKVSAAYYMTGFKVSLGDDILSISDNVFL